jgi:asparagine synthase (glutamine-hydrolysing)
MCGICGTAGFAEPDLLERMIDLMAHRGPDDRGVYLSPDGLFGLGNCRLSIIDLSPAGHMPMSNEDGTVWVTYNGETYNFRALRQELESLGHRFRSRTDSEVIVHGYEQWGVDLPRRLNGMFAFAVVDLRTRPVTLHLVRDRLGVKPLYYVASNERLIFGSEIKSILAAPGVSGRIDLESLHRYLAFLWVPGPQTMFRHIYKLLPGHYLTWRAGSYSTRPYWDARFQPAKDRKPRDLANDLRRILREAVERHMISDVPLGVFLSGGLDSSAIAALASEIGSEPLKTYTIAYRPEDSILEQSDEDASVAREVSERFGTKHHEIVVDPRVTDLLPEVVWHLDEPVADPAAISTYLICKAARPDVRVLLSGQGGDEIFAGYRVHSACRIASLMRAIPPSLRHGALSRAMNLLGQKPARIPGMNTGLALGIHRYLNKLVASADYDPVCRYVFLRSYYTDGQERALYAPELCASLSGVIAGARHLEYFGRVAEDSFVNRMLYVDMKTFLPELNLTYSDKLSSAASVEVRVPLLDNEVVEFMAGVPANLKLKGVTGKYLLRRALEDVLPVKVIRRRKAGFGAPIRAWLRRDLKTMVDDILSDDTIRRRGYFEPAAIRAMIVADRDGREDNALRIWALLTFELWHRSFIDKSLDVPRADCLTQQSIAC